MMTPFLPAFALRPMVGEGGNSDTMAFSALSAVAPVVPGNAPQDNGLTDTSPFAALLAAFLAPAARPAESQTVATMSDSAFSENLLAGDNTASLAANSFSLAAWLPESPVKPLALAGEMPMVAETMDTLSVIFMADTLLPVAANPVPAAHNDTALLLPADVTTSDILSAIPAVASKGAVTTLPATQHTPPVLTETMPASPPSAIKGFISANDDKPQAVPAGDAENIATESTASGNGISLPADLLTSAAVPIAQPQVIPLLQTPAVPVAMQAAAAPVSDKESFGRETDTVDSRPARRRPAAGEERSVKDSTTVAAADKASTTVRSVAEKQQGDTTLSLPGDNKTHNSLSAPDTAHHRFMETLQGTVEAPSSPSGSDITGTASPGANTAAPQALKSESTANALPVPQHPAHMPLPVVEQLAVHIRKMSRDNAEHIRIQLEPAQLGVVEISMTIAHDGTVQAVLSADKSDTLQWLKQDAAHLQKMLEDSGLSVGMNGMQFEDRSQQQQNRFVAYQEAFQDAVSSRHAQQATLHLGFAAPLPSSLAPAPDASQRLDVKI